LVSQFVKTVKTPSLFSKTWTAKILNERLHFYGNWELCDYKGIGHEVNQSKVMHCKAKVVDQVIDEKRQ